MELKALHFDFVAAVRAWWELHRRHRPFVAGAIYWDTDHGGTCYRKPSDLTRLKNLAKTIGYTGPIWDAVSERKSL